MCAKEEQLEESDGSDWPSAERRRRSRFDVADGGSSGGTPAPPVAFAGADTAPMPPQPPPVPVPELNALESTDAAGVGGGAAGVCDMQLVSVALDCCCVGVEGAREPNEKYIYQNISELEVHERANQATSQW